MDKKKQEEKHKVPETNGKNQPKGSLRKKDKVV